MEQYIQGQSRDLIDKAYTKLVSITSFNIATNFFGILNVAGKFMPY
jgi:hypothetical protein